MLDKIRELERLLEPEQNDYLVALRERISPIRGKASLGQYSSDSQGRSSFLTDYGDDFGDGDDCEEGFEDGYGGSGPSGDGQGDGGWAWNCNSGLGECIIPYTGDGIGSGICHEEDNSLGKDGVGSGPESFLNGDNHPC